MTHEEFINAIKGMSVIELMDLVKALEAEFGVSAAAPVAAAAAPGAAAAAPAEEQTEFDVVLVDAGAEKIKVIKVVREVVRPGPEGSQGIRGSRSQDHQGSCLQGRSQEDRRSVRRRWREVRDQVISIEITPPCCLQRGGF